MFIKNLIKIKLIGILSIPWKVAKPDKVFISGFGKVGKALTDLAIKEKFEAP